MAQLGARYFNVMGPLEIAGRGIGKHTLAASLKIRYAEDLDRDRQFLLGASNGLRGFEDRTFFGDKSILLNLEDRVSFSENVFQLVNIGAAFFVDVGGVTDESPAKLFQDNIFADIGFGLRLGFPRSSGGSVWRVDLAFPLREGPDGSSKFCLLYTSPSPRDATLSRMPSSA